MISRLPPNYRTMSNIDRDRILQRIIDEMNNEVSGAVRGATSSSYTAFLRFLTTGDYDANNTKLNIDVNNSPIKFDFAGA